MGLDCLLFLPAAGFSHDNGQTQRPNSAGRYAGDSAASGTRQLCPIFDESIVQVGDWNRCRRHSVRLACVVSEDLTHAGKCQKMLFVILSAAKNLCLNCWFSVHLLFLPAAGLRRPNAKVDNVGSEFTTWSNVASGQTSAYRVTVSEVVCNLKAGIDRAYGWSVRLASVVSEVLTEDVSSVPSCCGVYRAWKGVCCRCSLVIVVNS